MGDWKTVLKGDSIRWLLERDNPSVRFYVLTDILEKPENDPEVIEAKLEIMSTGVVPKILAKQKNGGYWENAESFYTAKYRGTVWQLIFLSELGADGKNERIRKACEFILENSQDRESGGFSSSKSETGGGSHDNVLPCLTGNMIWSLIRFGYLEDARVQRGINWIVRYQRFDDGIDEELKGWPYDRQGHPHCWGYTQTHFIHTCHVGVARTLKALAEIPQQKRSKDVENTIKKGAEYLLKHHVHKRSHNLGRISNPRWLKFGFPLWQTNALDILFILTKLGYRDERMQEAIDLVISKQGENGRWKLESLPSPQGTFYRNFGVNLEQRGNQSKWITLNALRVLKRFYDYYNS